MKKLVFPLLMSALLLSFVSNSKAQVTCPTGWTGPIGWTYSLPGGCGITVWWCDSADVSLIEEIDISGDTSACTDYGNIILSADSAVMAYPLRSMPPCGQGTTTNHTTWQTYCWSTLQPSPNFRTLLPCQRADWIGYCTRTCQICKSPTGAVVESNCTYSTTGFPPGCEVQPSSGYWDPLHCYIVNCPN